MKDKELIAIFEEHVVIDPCDTNLVMYNDGDAYLNRKRGKKTHRPHSRVKPLPPSQQAVKELYEGSQGSLQKVIKTYAGRAVLIGTALAVFGDNRNQKALIKNSLVASASIEAFLLYWYNKKHK